MLPFKIYLDKKELNLFFTYFTSHRNIVLLLQNPSFYAVTDNERNDNDENM